MKLFSFFVIGILFLQASLFIHAANSLAVRDGEVAALALDKKHHPKKINCSHACSRRCKESSRKKLCHRACKTCCKRCHCVPPGTSGNKEACPCYASLKTHGNKSKCP
ncbi:hypothetical protein ACOSQ2_009647 [Xanthoceras sorbifolium]